MNLRLHYLTTRVVDDGISSTGTTTVTRSLVGPRGIDAQIKGSSVRYPLYDTHGNAKAMLSRSGSTFSTDMWRHYDVWGSIRSGLTAGGASQRYCANLGHVADDESGLVYMRARYYEPWTGRYVSQDPTLDAKTLYTYCGNSPAHYADSSGRKRDDEWGDWDPIQDMSTLSQGDFAHTMFLYGLVFSIVSVLSLDPVESIGAAAFAVASFAAASYAATSEYGLIEFLSFVVSTMSASITGAVAFLTQSEKSVNDTLAASAGVLLFPQGLLCLGEILSKDLESM